MTIKVDRLTAPDLYMPNSSLNIDAARLHGHRILPPLSAITYIAEKQSPTDKLSTLADACQQRVEKVVYDHDGYRVLLFIADGPWQPKSAIVKRKKLWGRPPWTQRVGLFEPLSEETAIERECGVRYTALASVPRKSFALAIEDTRKDKACAILLRKHSPELDAADARSIFISAFPSSKGVESTAIDWTSLALFACRSGDIVVRVSGVFDDPSAAIDLIFDPTRHAAASL